MPSYCSNCREETRGVTFCQICFQTKDPAIWQPKTQVDKEVQDVKN